MRIECALAAAAVPLLATSLLAQAQNYDIVIYGGTSSGIAAAVQAARMGKTVALIEPTGRIGGMTTNGLSFTDTGNSSAIQGLAREFYTDVAAKYGGSGMELKFEPKVALSVFDQWVTTPGITLFRNERLDLAGGVAKTDGRISSIRMESGLTFGGAMFIDAGYEGDLMAGAGVSYAVGREANTVYGERYNGVVTSGAGSGNHNFSASVSPYIIAGDPTSGLLPGIDPTGPGTAGSGDNRIQSYNFRLIVTKAANRQAWTAPAGYNASEYELLYRHIQANGVTKVAGTLLKLDAIRGGKYDMNNQGAVSTDFIGQNYAFPDADHATREEIVAAHKKWQQGLLYFLATDPRLPATIRSEMNSYGLTADEFTDTAGWSEQIYVREARRMIGQYVMTDKNVLGDTDVTDSIGLASYTMDSHHTQRYITSSGYVRNEGNVQVSVAEPFSLSYRSITPLEQQASNLLVTAALSSSHIAYGSIRMEPVFMTTGQAGGAAAALAIDQNTTVQGLDYQLLRTELISTGALLEWPANRVDALPSALTLDFNSLAPLPKSIRYTAEGQGFSGTWDGTNTQNAVAGDLIYSRGGYAVAQSPGAASGKLQGNYSASRQNYRDLATAMDGEIWFSFLANNPDADGKAGLSLNPTTNGDPAQGPVANYVMLAGQTLRISLNGQITDAALTLATGDTHLLLARLVISSTGNELLEVWADPANLAALGEADLSIATQDPFAQLTRLGLLSYGDADSLGGYLDAIRFSSLPTAFADVTGIPEPAMGLLALLAAPLLSRQTRRYRRA